MTGAPHDYDSYEEAILETALEDAWAAYEGESVFDGTVTGGGGAGGGPSRMQVSGRIEWAGEYDRSRGGHRTTTLSGLNLAVVKPLLTAAKNARERADRSDAARSHGAKGWQAQLRALTASARGSAAADRAGLSPSARTLTAWLSEDRAPSKSNQERIAEAYAGMREDRVSESRGRAERANHAAIEKLNDVIREQYGADVRVTDLRSIQIFD